MLIKILKGNFIFNINLKGKIFLVSLTPKNFISSVRVQKRKSKKNCQGELKKRQRNLQAKFY